MEEIFEIIKAINRLKDKIAELSAKVDLIPGKSSLESEEEYLDETTACKYLHVSPRTLARMRQAKVIPSLKDKRKVRFKRDDLKKFLESQSNKLL